MATPKDKDKPKVHSSHGTLEDVEAVGAYVHCTQAGKRVHFPDITEMEWEEVEDWLADVQGRSNSYVLRKWLSEDDFSALKEDRLTFLQMSKLMTLVQRHYAGVFGDPGEADASQA